MSTVLQGLCKGRGREKFFPKKSKKILKKTAVNYSLFLKYVL